MTHKGPTLMKLWTHWNCTFYEAKDSNSSWYWSNDQILGSRIKDTIFLWYPSCGLGPKRLAHARREPEPTCWEGNSHMQGKRTRTREKWELTHARREKHTCEEWGETRVNPWPSRSEAALPTEEPLILYRDLKWASSRTYQNTTYPLLKQKRREEIEESKHL